MADRRCQRDIARWLEAGVYRNERRGPATPVDSRDLWWTADARPRLATADYPFWSPDSASVAFFTNDRLAARLADGRTTVICDVKGARRSGA
jgi:hypothetical protein